MRTLAITIRELAKTMSGSHGDMHRPEARAKKAESTLKGNKDQRPVKELPDFGGILPPDKLAKIKSDQEKALTKMSKDKSSNTKMLQQVASSSQRREKNPLDNARSMSTRSKTKLYRSETKHSTMISTTASDTTSVLSKETIQ